MNERFEGVAVDTANRVILAALAVCAEKVASTGSGAEACDWATATRTMAEAYSAMPPSDDMQ